MPGQVGTLTGFRSKLRCTQSAFISRPPPRGPSNHGLWYNISMSPHAARPLKKGFIALITVLIITAVSVIIGTTVVMKSISHASMSASELYSAKAWAAANGCVEYALGQFSLSSTTFTTYPGLLSQTVGGTLCTITLVASGNSKVIKASSTVSSFVRKLQVTVATNTPQSVISSWQEVGDFTL